MFSGTEIKNLSPGIKNLSSRTENRHPGTGDRFALMGRKKNESA